MTTDLPLIPYTGYGLVADGVDLPRRSAWILHPSPLDHTMSLINFSVNGRDVQVDVDPNTPMLWVLRDHLKLIGTKYGCGIAQCGSCTIHLNGAPVRSCVLPVSSVVNQTITTIEGLSADGTHPVQEAWLEHDVPQCGFCQAGQMMSAAALLAQNPSPSDEEIDAGMDGNLCRCGTYLRIHAAIRTAAARMG